MPDHYYNHSRRSHRALADPYNTSAYPGISPYGQTPSIGDPELLPSYGVGTTDSALTALPVVETTPKPGGLAGLLGGLGGGAGGLGNMEQIKGIIDRMGGIDGIVNSMGKVQKVMSGFQQMAPMVKLFMGNFGKGKGTGSAGALAAEEDAALYRPRRRKKKSTTQRRKSSSQPRRRVAPASGKRRRK